MRGMMAALAALVLGGCVSSYEEVEQPYTPQLLERVLGSVRSFTIVRADATVVTMYEGRDFGAYVCGVAACAPKSDIARIRYLQSGIDPGGTALAVLLAPALPILLIAPTGNDYEVPALRELSPDDRASPWLRNYVVWSDRRTVTRAENPNPCVDAANPAHVAQSFASDAEAAAWLWPHRWELSAACLVKAVDLYLLLGDRPKALDIWALGEARDRWERFRCTRGGGPRALRDVIVTPPVWSDLSPGHGDPAALGVIRATLADPRLFAYQPDLAFVCAELDGVLPDSEWPRVRDYVLSLAPPAAD